ncbi:hypothetical protein RF55_13263 [Lasius niger]|uniref:Peptidase aspartic putative domain-containing protein n=1 Tax=Lasius niger TaxID=67767 RepID=A0A0J7KB07_LASNI|nr:hypothetical protein RF55_13263 [Lasius niger]
MSQDFDTLIRSQTKLQGRIIRAHDNFKKMGAANITQGAIEARLQNLEANWNKFEGQHDILQNKHAAALRNHEYNTKDLIETVEEQYIQQRAIFLDLLLEMRSNADNTLTNVERLHYLKTSLKGEAEKLVRNFTITGDNFERVWSALTEHYENKRLLVKSYCSAFTSLPRMKSETASELKRLFHSITGMVGALDSIGRPILNCSDMFVHMAVELLDSRSSYEWETAVSGSAEPPSYEILKHFLDRRLYTLEALSTARPDTEAIKSTGKSVNATAQSARAQSTRKQNSRCPLCQQDHYILHCSEYQQKQPRQRLEVVSTKDLCLNCLGQHLVTECQSKKSCMTCKERHHTTLHEACSTTGDTSALSSHVSNKVYETVQLSRCRDVATDQDCHSNVLFSNCLVEFLLGADTYAAILRPGLCNGGPLAPLAQQTTLGWILSGIAGSRKPQEAISSNQCAIDDQLTVLVRQFWEQED